MVTVGLPPAFNATAAAALPSQLLASFGTWVPTVCFAGGCWVRVSAAVYNDLSDFQFLADAVASLAPV